MNVVAILGAVGAGTILAELVRAFLGRRQATASSTDVITQAAERAVSMISADNQRLRDQVEGLTLEVQRLSDEIGALRQQVAVLEDENERLLAELVRTHPLWRPDPS